MRLRATRLTSMGYTRFVKPSLILDRLSTSSTAAFSLRKLRRSYNDSAIRVRRSTDQAETNIGFATVEQTRTNLDPVPAADGDSRTSAGITRTVVGTGTEFGQSYIDIRWNGTATAVVNLRYCPTILTASPNATTNALVTPGQTYTSSMGYRLVSGTWPALTARLTQFYRNGTALVGEANNALPTAPNAALQRSAVIGVAPATANYVQNIFQMDGLSGLVCDFTMRFYAPNTELGTGNARPLLQRYVAETIAAVGDLDANALLNFVGSASAFISNWYDQSGNSHNVGQATQASQPTIVNAGAINTRSGRPSIFFNGSQWLGNNAPLPVTQAFSVMASTGLPSTAAEYATGGASGLLALRVVGTEQRRVGTSGSNNDFNDPLNIDVLRQYTDTGNSNTMRRNGIDALAGLTSISTAGVNMTIGARDGAIPMLGHESELLFFGTTISTPERRIVEINQAAYFGLLPVLDQITASSAAAFGLRKLRFDYTGSAIRVRRSSDNTEQDIGFTSTGDLNTAALLTFVGGSNGFITNWYDQSGAAYQNLLTRSENVDQSPWTVDNGGASNPTITPDFALAPNGTMTADRVQLNKTGGTFSRLQQTITRASDTYTYSVYLKNNGVGVVNVGIRVGVTGANRVVTTSWQRFTLTTTEINPICQILLFDSIAGNDETADILVWGNQLNTGATAQPYQQTTDSPSNTRDARQATIASQPMIVNAGALITVNGRPSIEGSGSNVLVSGAASDWTRTTTYGTNNVVAVRRAGSGTDVRGLIGGGASSVFSYLELAFAATGFRSNTRSTPALDTAAVGNVSTLASVTTTASPTNLSMRINGSQAANVSGAASTPVASTSGLILFGRQPADAGDGLAAPGFMSEAHIFKDVGLSVDDGLIIQRNQGAYFGITVA